MGTDVDIIELVHCEYDDTPYDPESDDGCPTCEAFNAEQEASYAWMERAAQAARECDVLGMSYEEQMRDAGRGHLL